MSKDHILRNVLCQNDCELLDVSFLNVITSFRTRCLRLINPIPRFSSTYEFIYFFHENHPNTWEDTAQQLLCKRTRSSVKVVFKDVAATALEIILKNKREYINHKQTESFNNRRTSKKLILIPLVACCESVV